ncbi:ABC transporter ATP-binding protein [Paenibacillus sp. ACRRX]|uniref:ABC transporter ATP-binding protein n=1 Tax=Paenibacillus sp. ACRRX TaxID=2918206 RepID=UPI001EF5C72D|nr:ABC transporter ATP-binding protein [Paenibacillus sp. ACRRX]MCG7408264.1 ABC transporter ATP-binding protein [Paenibacillus sp. ACRRX]
MTHVLEVADVVKGYGGKTALDKVNIHVREGSCFGLLGPNGAGKSTLMKLMTGILQADSGIIRAFDMDTRHQMSKIRQLVGYVPQEITLYEKLSAVQNLKFFGEMYGVKGAELKRRIENVLEQVGLSDRASEAVGTYSGGMKRRINLAAALLHQPQLVILDEPTVGIDPQSRNHIFEMIRGLRKEGLTLVYSTHYMEEVEALCDDIAIIDHGSVIAQGSLHEILERHADKAVYVESDHITEPPQLSGIIQASARGRGWVLESEQPLNTLHDMSRLLAEAGANVHALELVKPSLDRVFLKLTGTALRD